MVTLVVGDNLHASVLVDTHAATHDYVLPRSMPNTVNGTCLASSACEQAKMRTTAQPPPFEQYSRRVYPPIQYEYAGNEDMELVPYTVRVLVATTVCRHVVCLACAVKCQTVGQPVG